MIELQRASAGSGKTYTLAKKYIWYLITYTPEEINPVTRLRSDRELADSSRHILAMTFTNKATNEMQVRILKALHKLAHKPVTISREEGHVTMDGPDYMEDFVKDLNGVQKLDQLTDEAINDTVAQIAAIAGKALILLLENFSDFNVSTIDSFFQLVLRTLAYEVELNDNYQVELDGEYLSQVSVDGTLEEMDSHDVHSDTYYWVQKIIGNSKSKGWQLFERKMSSRNNFQVTAYASLVGKVMRLDNEQYKKIRKDVEKYLASKPNLRALYEGIEKDFNLQIQASGKEAVEGSKEYKLWQIYKQNMPYLALFDILNTKRREYLEETGSVELAETSSILRSIIRDDDVPFIYERLSTKLNHYLIDEFQDTSRLQWENIYPLLKESLSHGHANLVIGDAKQSIYRFRNADPSIITEAVPQAFPGQLVMRGSGPGENANYRSDHLLVRFNNEFFKYCAERLDYVSSEMGRDSFSFSNLYSNVVQVPKKMSKRGEPVDGGYVKFLITDDAKNSFMPLLMRQVTDIVEQLLERGYRKKDICILVDTNAQAADVVQAFNDLNDRRAEDGLDKIEIQSEESLKVSSSQAVKIIVNVLQTMAKGLLPPDDGEPSRSSKRVYHKWSDIQAAFKLYCMEHPEGSMAEKLDAFLADGTRSESITRLVASMPSLAIPALVEGVVASFVSENLRRSDGAYIAAFQDNVLEYCERHSTDIASFLQWWERRGKKASITPARDADAVTVMTIHKSKGLEFDCVLVPFADWDMADPGKNGRWEWKWIQPEPLLEGHEPLPPYLPIDLNLDVRGTQYEPLLTDFMFHRKMDDFNKAYVAFTRAKKELYIFSVSPNKLVGAKKSKNDSPRYPSMAMMLFDFVQGKYGQPTEDMESRLPSSLLNCGEPQSEVVPTGSRKKTVVTLEASIGEQDPELMRWKQIEAEEEAGETISEIEGYNCLIPSKSMDVCREEDLPDDEMDIRTEGRVKHSILENVTVAEDLPKAVTAARLAGLLDKTQAEEIEKELRDKLADARVSRWFDGKSRILAERSLLCDTGGKPVMRPDRIVIFDDGHAEIVDYKFGKLEEDPNGENHRQVRQYKDRLLATGKFDTVQAYLWYVNYDSAILEV